MSEDLVVQVPGEEAEVAPPPARRARATATVAPPPAPIEPDETEAELDPEIARLEAEIVELRQRVAVLTDQLAMANEDLIALQSGEALSAPAAEAQPKAPVLVGEDWSSMTAEQARAAGCTRTVLCSDGYYVPPSLA